MRLASDEPHILRSVREVSLVTLAVSRPDPDDEIIARYAESDRLAWMHAKDPPA
jgi:hypothetical protein